MARPIKAGLEYFPLDVDFFDDPKILYVADRFGDKGELIPVKLLCWIYRNDGYFCEWTEDTAMIFAKKNFSSIKAQLCQDVVSELIKRGFFNKHLFDTFGILTSKGIQERWLHVITNSKRKSKLIPEYSLLLTEVTPPKTELTTAEADGSTHSIAKESIVYSSAGEFLKDWNELRTKHLNKPSNLNTLGNFTTKADFKELSEIHTRQEFREALVGLFRQQKMPKGNEVMRLDPKHFLAHFNRYLSAFQEQIDTIYGKADTEE